MTAASYSSGAFPRKLNKRESKVVETAVAAAAAADPASTQTLTNKTIDGDDNTIKDLAVTVLKTASGNADKVVMGTTTSGVPKFDKIVDANVDGSAAIAQSKLSLAITTTQIATSAGNADKVLRGATTSGAPEFNKIQEKNLDCAAGSASQVLTSNGSGVLSFAAQSFLQSSVSVSLTAAEIAGLYGTSKQLVAAPAGGHAIVVDSVEVFHDFDTAAYTGGGDLQVQYANTNHAGGTAICVPGVACVTGGTDSNTFIKPVIYDGPAGFDLGAQAAAGVFLSNKTQVFADGSAANILKVVVKYRDITLAV